MPEGIVRTTGALFINAQGKVVSSASADAATLASARQLPSPLSEELAKRYQLTDGLAKLTLPIGDRVAVVLSQSLELPVAHLAAFRSGLVSVPLFTLFGEDALQFRLENSGAKAVVTDEGGWEKLSKIRDRLREVLVAQDPQ